MQLTLSEPVKKEVSDNFYKQSIKLGGRPLDIQTPHCFLEHGLKMLIQENMTAVLVPLDEATKTSLRTVEKFVVKHVNSQKYKQLPLNNDTMFVNVSKWCAYEKASDSGFSDMIPPGTFMGPGTYSLKLRVSHVYVGPHRGGETFSLSLHVLKITYMPKQDDAIVDNDIMSLFEELGKGLATPTPIATSTPKPRAKQSRRNRRTDPNEANGAPPKIPHVL